MAIFIELTTDPFEERMRNQRDRRLRSDGRSRSAGAAIARRPMRGLEIKEDRFASIKIIDASGREVPLVDGGSYAGTGRSGTAGYTNFILQTVQEARMEKHQIVETFGETYIFFFGESPRFLDVQVVILNSLDFNWEAEWWENYDRFFRGTKLVEMGARLYLFYDDNIVEGYMLSSQATKLSDQPFLVQMNFRLFLTGHRNITFVGDPNYPIRASVALPPGVNLTDPNAAMSLTETLRDLALNDAKASGLPDAEARLLSGLNSFAGATALDRFGNQVPASGGISPSTAQLLDSIGFGGGVRDTPLRGKIADNRDEYLGIIDDVQAPNYETGSLGLPSLQASTIRSQQEVEDLHLAAIESLKELGADVDNPAALKDLGLMPLPRSGPVTGVGAQSREGAGLSSSFTPIAGASFGTSVTSSSVASSSIGAQDQSPLGSVFGGGAQAGISTRANVQGAGDKDYGYDSSFSSGPGFGQAGYGDFGGNGFGSGQGAGGDPGYKSPDLFTFEGVSDNEAAFNRFNKPRKNNTVFGGTGKVGLGATTAGKAGGASSKIEGKPTSFSIVSTEGRVKTRVRRTITVVTL